MTALNFDVTVEQGATFPLQLTLRDVGGSPLDLTGFVFAGGIKERFADAAYLASFAFTMNNPATDGVVVIAIPASGTGSLHVNPPIGIQRNKTVAFYDVKYTRPDGEVVRVIEGKALISPEVTI